jgi:hypothetical protein
MHDALMLTPNPRWLNFLALISARHPGICSEYNLFSLANIVRNITAVRKQARMTDPRSFLARVSSENRLFSMFELIIDCRTRAAGLESARYGFFWLQDVAPCGTAN